MNLFSSTNINLLERALNGSALSQRAISQNIANVDTPNFKAKQVHFQDTLKEAMENAKLRAYRTDSRHYEFGTNPTEPYITVRKDTMYNHNLNNVDIDKEMSDLAKNQIYYSAIVERVNGGFNSLATAIKGGR
ncbi:MAG TPA: flagellar basal body rod protein FlgB [Bacilli bacterium]|nr:flagellar basal body rod protein FlgB [Bacilli bacterium]